ncbi:hypothetical protein ATANTOWER_018311 [Ataeniobius toweri]|uniref:Uncharacterized protein n=1 Tax=Ataeniobius toweri TaxID=208326 RepID=A0ABU7APV3_9TELE|nr:hypothetical protein [Ataeniobius toweri]
MDSPSANHRLQKEAESSCTYSDCLHRVKHEKDPAESTEQISNIQPKTNFTTVKSLRVCSLKSLSLLLSWLTQKLPHKVQNCNFFRQTLEHYQSRQRCLSSLLLLPHHLIL